MKAVSFSQSFSAKCAEKIIKYKIVFIVTCIVVTLFFLYALKDITIETNLSDFAPQDHSFMKVQKSLTDIFGGLNQVSIAVIVKQGDIFNYQTLNKVVMITRKLYLLQGINPGRVVSLAARKIKNVKANEEGFKVQRLMRSAPNDPNQLEALRQAVTRNPMIYGPLVSKDLKATLITADFQPQVDSRTIFREIKNIIEPLIDNNNDIRVTGRPVLEGWFDQYIPAMGKVFGGTLLVMAALLYCAFRSKRGVLLPFGSALIATIWGMGMMVLCGYHIGPTTVLVPFLVFALGISHAVQFIKRYYEELKEHGLDCPQAARGTLSSLFIPAFISLVTDGIGFLSLFIVPLAIIKSMALAAGLGVLSIFFSTVLFIPPFLAIFAPPRKIEVEREEKTTILNVILAKTAALSQRGALRWVVLGVFLILGSISLIGIGNLVVGDNEPGSAALYPDSSYNLSDALINRLFTGSNPYFVFVQSEVEEGLIDYKALKEIESLQSFIQNGIEQAGYSLSLTDYIKSLNMVMMGGHPEEFKIPENNGTIAEYLFLYAISGFPGDFDPVVSPNYQYANIKVDFKDHRSETIRKAVSKTKEWIQKNHNHPGIEFLYGGGEIGTLGAINEIIEQTIPKNIMQVTLLVFLCVALAFGSITAGLLLIIPLLFNVLVTFGIMGLLGITLTLETLPVAALGIGLGVDYGIYVTTRICQEYSAGKFESLDEAILKSLLTSGKAVFFTGSTVAVGVFAWVFSDIRLQARLGLVLGALIFINVLGALVFLPVFLRTVKPKFMVLHKRDGTA